MKIVIALGGNALGNNAFEQLELVKESAKPLVDLIEAGHQLVIAHGNGPQVGMINQAFENSHLTNQTAIMPFAECGAMSQGYIGYHLQNALQNELKTRNLRQEVVALVTQVVVDASDPAFLKPTKPIGTFYSKEEAEKLEKENNYHMIEDAGRGYRRVIASPKPIDVVEKNVIKSLVEQGVVVITVGGGGIPVTSQAGLHHGISAVIDKDFASSKIAELIDADYLFILTAVDRVMINYNQPNQVALTEMNLTKARQYIEEGHFAPGSMLPKVEAAIQFVESGDNKISVIASLEKAKAALSGETGTKIIKN